MTDNAPSLGGCVSRLTRPKCAQLFLTFSGHVNNINNTPPTQFLQKSGLGNRNVTFLRDPTNTFYDNGISDDLPTFEAFGEWLQSYIAEQTHMRDVYCIGNSSGGYAALLYGYFLEVKKVWAFAPSGLRRVRFVRQALMQPNGITEYEIFYSRDHRADSYFAESLADCPGVLLSPMPAEYNDGHAVFRKMMERDQLAALFPPLVSV